MHLNGIWLLFSIWNGTKTLNAFHFQQHRKRNEPCLFIAGLLCFSYIFHCHFAIINRKIYYVPSDNCAHVKRHMHNEIEKEPLFLLFFCRLFFCYSIERFSFHSCTRLYWLFGIVWTRTLTLTLTWEQWTRALYHILWIRFSFIYCMRFVDPTIGCVSPMDFSTVTTNMPAFVIFSIESNTLLFFVVDKSHFSHLFLFVGIIHKIHGI